MSRLRCRASRWRWSGLPTPRTTYDDWPTPAIEAIAALANEARRLLGDPARYEDLADAIAAIVRMGEMATTIGPLGDAVRQLNNAAAALSTTVTPLQGASERLGRFVDRLPGSTRRPIEVDADPA